MIVLINQRRSFLLPFLFLLVISQTAGAQSGIDKILPVRAFCIGAPKTQNLERFVKFINEELPDNKVNTLILRIDFNYQYESHPELRDSIALSKEDVKQLVNACKQNNIRLIPQINLLGHQSWASKTTNLLKLYPEFDETPHVLMPEIYTWPNVDSLYCKSYCPLHPEVHNIIFDLVDEICDVFETNAFHAGMDEVFYIGNDKCPRCSGKDKAELFAGEVNKIRNHLALKKRQLWIWGDRLLDGRSTGIGEWEGSFNNTHKAVDLVAKDVVICDWHYDKAEQTAVYFAGKGLSVITSTWRTPAVAITQTQDMVKYRKSAKPKIKNRYQGVMQTIWTNPDSFLDEYYAAKLVGTTEGNTQANCFKALAAEMNKLSTASNN
ncbi:MAG: family 20 glycosylhydrolase [Ferruginibacter sp.]